jgi:hypothetical protein
MKHRATEKVATRAATQEAAQSALMALYGQKARAADLAAERAMEAAAEYRLQARSYWSAWEKAREGRFVASAGAACQPELTFWEKARAAEDAREAESADDSSARGPGR